MTPMQHFFSRQFRIVNQIPPTTKNQNEERTLQFFTFLNQTDVLDVNLIPSNMNFSELLMRVHRSINPIRGYIS